MWERSCNLFTASPLALRELLYTQVPLFFHFSWILLHRGENMKPDMEELAWMPAAAFGCLLKRNAKLRGEVHGVKARTQAVLAFSSRIEQL